MNRKANVARNFNCLIETEGLLKVTGSQVHCKSGTVSEKCKIEKLLLYSVTDHE